MSLQNCSIGQELRIHLAFFFNIGQGKISLKNPSLRAQTSDWQSQTRRTVPKLPFHLVVFRSSRPSFYPLQHHFQYK